MQAPASQRRWHEEAEAILSGFKGWGVRHPRVTVLAGSLDCCDRLALLTDERRMNEPATTGDLDMNQRAAWRPKEELDGQDTAEAADCNRRTAS